MSPSSPGRRGPAPSRTHEQLGEAAIGLADAQGLPAVTMRAVAEAVGLAPAALYRYVASRDELLHRMTDAALADLAVPAPTGDPGDDLVALARAQLAALRRHPWLADAIVAAPPGPNGIQVLEAGLRVLAPAPAGGAAKLELLALVTGIATLFARSGGDPAPGAVEAVAAAAPTHPHLAAAFAAPGAARPPEELLDHAVRALLAGLLPASG
jgi:AcrR family transcriptional regulator